MTLQCDNFLTVGLYPGDSDIRRSTGKTLKNCVNCWVNLILYSLVHSQRQWQSLAPPRS
jgi:hypothetical protein